MKYSLPKGQMALAAATLLLALGGSAAYAETPSWCGPKKATIALLDGFGGNSWRLVTTASGARQKPQKCPSITDYQYADGQGNTQKAISDINSMAARGIDALVVFGDAGPAVLPALTNVFKAGKVVVPYRVVVGGEEGKNYTKFVGASFKDDGVSWGNWIKSILPNGGNLLFLSGPAGNSQGVDELEGLKSVLGTKYKFINPAPFDVTNWDPALTQQVLTAEIAKNDEDRRHRLRLRAVAGRRASGVQEVQPVDPRARHVGRQLARVLLDRQPEGQPGLQAVHRRDRQRQRAPGRSVGGGQGDRRAGRRRTTIFKAPELREFGDGQAERRCSAARTFPATSICRPRCPATIRQRPSTSNHRCRGPGGMFPAGAATIAAAT